MQNIVCDIPTWLKDKPITAEGVTISGTELMFDITKFTPTKAAQFIEDNAPFIEKAISKPRRFEPKEEDIAALKRYVIAKDVDKFNIFTFSAANNMVDYEQDRLTQVFLQKLADFINTKGPIAAMVDHDPEKRIGIVYAAQVIPMPTNPGHFELEAKVAVAPEIEVPGRSGLTVIRAVETGIFDNVSIRFNGPRRYIDENERSIREFYVDDSRQEAMITEISFVYFGGQRDARLKKEFQFKIINKANKMATKEFQIKTEGKNFDLKVTAEGESITVSGLDAVETEFKAVKESLKSANDRLTKALQPVYNKVQNLQGETCLKKSFKYTEDQLKAMDVDQLYALEKDLSAEWSEKNPAGQTDKEGNPVKKDEKKETETVYGKY